MLEKNIASLGEECESLMNYIKKLEALLRENGMNVPVRETTVQ